MASSIRFVVPGNPVPQPRPRISTRGGFARAYVPKEHPIHLYRLRIGNKAEELDIHPHLGDVAIDIAAVFARPPSHKRLGSKAPARPVKCDWDNVAKGVCDALNGIAYVDDDQIIDAHVTRRYARPGENAHTAIIITRL